MQVNAGVLVWVWWYASVSVLGITDVTVLWVTDMSLWGIVCNFFLRCARVSVYGYSDVSVWAVLV